MFGRENFNYSSHKEYVKNNFFSNRKSGTIFYQDYTIWKISKKLTSKIDTMISTLSGPNEPVYTERKGQYNY